MCNKPARLLFCGCECVHECVLVCTWRADVLTVFACHQAVCCLFTFVTQVEPFICILTMVRLAVPCQRCLCRVTHLCLQLGKRVNNSGLYVCACVCVSVCPPTQGSYSSTAFVMSGFSRYDGDWQTNMSLYPALLCHWDGNYIKEADEYKTKAQTRWHSLFVS